MINFLTKTVVVLALVLAFNSCIEDPKEPNQDENLGCLLSSYSSNDWEYQFIYDPNNQLSQVQYTNSDGANCTYNAIEYTGGKVSKMICSVDNYDVFYEQYFFNGNTTTVEYNNRDEYENWSLDERFIFTYNSSGQISKMDYYIKDEGYNMSYISYTYYTWQNGNIVKTTRWLNPEIKRGTIRKPKVEIPKPFNFLKSTDSDLFVTATFEYDDKPNAFSSLGLFFLEDAMPRNNITKITETYYEGSQNIANHSYNYEETGFPFYGQIEYINNDGSTNSYVSSYGYQCE